MNIDQLQNLQTEKNMKKIEGLSKKLKRAITLEGFREPDFTVATEVRWPGILTVRVECNSFIDDERHFDRNVKDISGLAETVANPTRIIDNSHFGGHNISMLKRGRKIDADALLSHIELILRFPINKF